MKYVNQQKMINFACGATSSILVTIASMDPSLKQDALPILAATVYSSLRSTILEKPSGMATTFISALVGFGSNVNLNYSSISDLVNNIDPLLFFDPDLKKTSIGICSVVAAYAWDKFNFNDIQYNHEQSNMRREEAYQHSLSR